MAKDGQQRKQEARERARQRREAELRKARQRKIYTYTGAVIAVVAVVVAVVLVAINNKSKDENANVTASPAIVTALTSVPAANFDQVGKGTSTGGISPVTGQPPLTANGKPEVLYVGAEYCPYCAAERWAMVTALARFGTFSGLQTTKSSSQDVFPSTATLSFLTTTYTSDHVTFTSRETQDRAGKSIPTQELTSAQASTFKAIAPKGGIPFVDIANKYFINGAQFDPNVLKGLTAEEIATQAGNPGTDIGKAVLGSANLITAAICKATDNQPAAVCNSSAVTSVAGSLTGGSTDGSSSN